MIVYEYEQVDLHGETMSFIRPTDKVWKKDPDKFLSNSKETVPFCFWIEPLDTQRFSPVPFSQRSLQHSPSTSLEACPNLSGRFLGQGKPA